MSRRTCDVLDQRVPLRIDLGGRLGLAVRVRARGLDADPKLAVQLVQRCAKADGPPPHGVPECATGPSRYGVASIPCDTCTQHHPEPARRARPSARRRAPGAAPLDAEVPARRSAE